MNFLPRIPLMGLIGGIAGPLSRSMAARVVVLGYLGPRVVTWIQQDSRKETQSFLPSICCKMRASLPMSLKDNKDINDNKDNKDNKDKFN